MELVSGVTTLPDNDVLALYMQVQHLGVPVYVLETRPPADREAFFAAVRNVLPLDPPLASSRSWDALTDSLWEGLETLNSSRVVILWPDAHQMKSWAPSDYEIAVSVLQDVANSLLEDRMEVCVYLSASEKTAYRTR